MRPRGQSKLQKALAFAFLPHQIQKYLVNARIVGEFGMERGRHGASLLNGYGSIIVTLGSDNFYAFPDMLDLRGADKNHFQRRLGAITVQQFAFTDGAVDLTSVGIAADANVERAQANLLGIFYFSRQQDRAGAGAKGGFVLDELFQFFESAIPEEFEKRAGFTARND